MLACVEVSLQAELRAHNAGLAPEVHSAFGSFAEAVDNSVVAPVDYKVGLAGEAPIARRAELAWVDCIASAAEPQVGRAGQEKLGAAEAVLEKSAEPLELEVPLEFGVSSELEVSEARLWVVEVALRPE